jgi:hypothetical protein
MMHIEILLMAAIFQSIFLQRLLRTNSQSRGAPVVALPSLFKVGLTFVF